MKYGCILALLILLLSCAHESIRQHTLTHRNLSSYYVKVNHQQNQLIRAPKGGVIYIKAGTFDKDVELEIKEAYTMKDMLLGGLRTESDGKSLRSGGMIYINTRNGSVVAVNKPISVLLPATYIDTAMKLYKGETDEDSSINWKEADTLQPTLVEENIKEGQALYQQHCATCHAIDKALTGPALRGVQYRGPLSDSRELVKFVHNPPLYIANDKTGYTKNLQDTYKALMTPFPQLPAQDIRNIMAYVRNATPQQIAEDDSISAARSRATDAYRPCNGMDTTYFDERDTITVPEAEINQVTSNAPLLPIDTALGSGEELRRGFTDSYASPGAAYRFNIQTLGWYNVDSGLLGQPNTVLCDLKVRVSNAGSQLTELDVYAFFPLNKNLSVGYDRQGDVFEFNKINGKIPLYLGEKGTAVVFGAHGEQFYYGIASFRVQRAQVIDVTVIPATKEAFLKAIQSESIEGINFDLQRQQMRITPCSTGGDSIRKVIMQ